MSPSISRLDPSPCDNCSHKEATFICTKCLGLFCADCVAFKPSTEKNPIGDVLCYRCDGVGGAASHQRRMGGART